MYMCGSEPPETRAVVGSCCSSLVFVSAVLQGVCGKELWLSWRSESWSSFATDLLSIEMAGASDVLAAFLLEHSLSLALKTWGVFVRMLPYFSVN